MKYAREENGQTVPYRAIPNVVIHNGQQVIGVNSISDDAKKEYGFYPIVAPDNFNPDYQSLTNDLTFDAQNEVYVRGVNNRYSSVAEVKQALLRCLKEQWMEARTEADFYIKELERQNQSIPSGVQTNLTNVFNLFENTRDDIKGLNTFQQVFAYSYPSNTIENALEYVRDLI